MIVADTDVLIDFLSGRGPGAKRVPLEVRRGQLHTTVVNQFEAIIRSLLGAMTTLSLDASAADQAARIRRDMERQGQSIGMGDSLIAGIVILHEGTLLTRNRRHFDRVPGLKLAEWQD